MIDSINPSSGDLIAKVFKSSEDYDKVIQASNEAFKEWKVPRPKRGELVRLMGNALRETRICLEV